MKQRRYFDVDEYISIDGESLSDLRKSIDIWITEYGSNAILVDKDVSGHQRLVIQEEREETDDEYNRRLRDEQYYREYVEKRDRENYERLKAKYEGDK